MTQLKGKRVWIIGASSGIGASLAHELVGRGCHVAISARRAASLAEVSAGTMVEVTADMRDVESLRAAHEQVTRQLGAPDIVVVAAGFWRRMDAASFDRAQFAEHIDANVMGLANCIDVVLPDMLQRRDGSIVGIASVAGYRGMPGAQGYGASKAAQLNLLESLRCGLQGTGVRVLTVAPGFVATPMTADNTFPMPFMVTAESAARDIADGIARGRAETVFPRRMMIVMKLARVVPQAWWPRLFGREKAAHAA